MTNKYMYFIANWKMFGGLNSLNTIDKVVKFFKIFKKNRSIKIIYCPPSTLIGPMSKKLKKTNIEIGAQNCHEQESYGAFTGSINSKMLKNIGAKYPKVFVQFLCTAKCAAPRGSSGQSFTSLPNFPAVFSRPSEGTTIKILSLYLLICSTIIFVRLN